MNSISYFVKNTENYNTLNEQEEIGILKSIKNGNNNAYEEFIKHNMKLVMKIANQFEHLGVSIEDLISVGTIGLMKAIEKYEIGKGSKFSSYAALWIKYYMRKELSENSRVICFCNTTLNKMKKVKELKEKNENSSVEDIAREMNTRGKNYISNLLNGYSQISMNQIIDENNGEIEDFFEEKSIGADTKLEIEDLIENMLKHIDKLNKNERIVLTYRYGLGGKRILTQNELASVLHYTRQRIQSIEKEAIDKLKTIMINEI